MLRKLLNWDYAPLISSWQDQRGNHSPMCQTKAGTPEVGISSAVFGVTLLVQQRRALKCIEQRELRSLLKGPSWPGQEPVSESALSSTRTKVLCPFLAHSADTRCEGWGECCHSADFSSKTVAGYSLSLRPGFSCFSEGDTSLWPPREGGEHGVQPPLPRSLGQLWVAPRAPLCWLKGGLCCCEVPCKLSIAADAPRGKAAFYSLAAASAAHSKLRYTEWVGYGELLLVPAPRCWDCPLFISLTVQCSRELRGKRGAEGRDQHGLGSPNVNIRCSPNVLVFLKERGAISKTPFTPLDIFPEHFTKTCLWNHLTLCAVWSGNLNLRATSPEVPTLCGFTLSEAVSKSCQTLSGYQGLLTSFASPFLFIVRVLI